jgi:SnoaL-like polyketide cyclase
MSSNVTTGADAAAAASAGPSDLAEASRRLLEESFNEGKVELIDQLVAPDAVNHDPATPAEMRGLRGPEVLKRTAGMYRAAFPDVRTPSTTSSRPMTRWCCGGTARERTAASSWASRRLASMGR